MSARPIRYVLALVALAALGAGLAPPPDALAASATASRAYAALTGAAIAGVIAVLPHGVALGRRRVAWIAAAALSLAIGVGAFLMAGTVQRACAAHYDGRAVLIGTSYTALGDAYAKSNPSLSSEELLFDAAGVAERVWTAASINRCRMFLSATHAMWIPLLAVCLFASFQVFSSGVLPRASAATTAASAERPQAAQDVLRYDVFISYRHGGRDTEFARELLAGLEAKGYVVAIDERDFPANAHFLHEMERCIRQSRFTVALISHRYLGSGNCEEEATICKVLDMGDRRRRLVPLIIESVTLPAWLFGIVGIDCTKADPLIDPFDKLLSTLGEPLRVQSTGASI